MAASLFRGVALMLPTCLSGPPPSSGWWVRLAMMRVQFFCVQTLDRLEDSSVRPDLGYQ